MGKTRSRALQWSKEVERRARDLYQRLYPDAQRAKFMGREDREGHPDIVGVPFHVQVKARDQLWVSSEWRRADAANETDGVTHLVCQAAGGPMLVCMKLSDYIEEIERVSNTGGSSLDAALDVSGTEEYADAREGDREAGRTQCRSGRCKGCVDELDGCNPCSEGDFQPRALVAAGGGVRS